MKKFLSNILVFVRKPARYAILFTAIVVTLYSGLAMAAIVWPTAPTGEPTNGLFMNYITKMLVNSDIATTDGKVKKAADSDTVGSGTLMTLAGNVGIGTNTPQAKLDVNGSVKANSLQVTTGAATGSILVTDSAGVATWQPNNYRLRVVGMHEGNSVGALCYLMSDSTSRCMGYNGHGQLSIGDTVNRYLPVTPPLSGIKKLFMTTYSNYALMNDGSVYVIGGYNAYGQLGVWTTANQSIPVKIAGLANVTDLALGKWRDNYDFVCALITGGTVKCWGYNGYGQVGDGTTVNKLSPTDVIGLTNVVSIKADGYLSGGHTCAVISDGTVKCWGYNGNNQLGDGTAVSKSVPTAVTGLSNVRDIYLGSGKSCAVLTDNTTLKCWGFNNYGQLGDGTTTNKTTPTVIATGGGSIKDILSTSADYFSTFILFNDGTIKSAGYNGYGQLGDGTVVAKTGFVPVSGISTATKIVSSGNGSYHTVCALLADTTVKCWGYNGYGQMGDGTLVTKYLPTSVLSLSNVVDIKMDGWLNTQSTCALLADGSVRCWGYNGYGELGVNDVNYYAVPVSVKNMNAD